MAKAENPYVVVDTVSFKNFYCLPVKYGSVKNNIIATVGRNSVSVVQVDHPKVLQNWTLKQAHSFTCPVVYSAEDSTLYSVVDNNTLRIWSYDDDNMDNGHKIKFQDSIFAILPVAGKQPVVVYNRGSCHLLTQAISKCGDLTKQYLDPGEELCWADALSSFSDTFIVLLTHSKNELYKLYSFILSGNEDEILTCSTQVISRNPLLLKSWCLRAVGKTIFFITIWSNGDVYSYSVDNKISKLLLTVPNINENSVLAVDIFDTSHIAVVKLSSSENKQGSVLEVWDSKFAVKKLSKDISSVLSQNLQVKVLGSTVFLSCHKNIIAIPVSIEESTLASAVGREVSLANTQWEDCYIWKTDGTLKSLPRESENQSFTSSLGGYASSKGSSQTLWKGVLSKLCNEGNVENTLIDCLSESQDVPEEEIVKMLKFCLRGSTQTADELEKIGTDSHPLSHNLFKGSRSFLLNKLLSLPYSGSILQHHLQKLSFKEAVITLHYLLRCKKESSERKNEGLSDFQLARWVQLLIESHLADFSVQKNKIGNLIQEIFYSLCNQYTILISVPLESSAFSAYKQHSERDNYEGLENVRPYMSRLRQKKSLPKNEPSHSYCIEILHI